MSPRQETTALWAPRRQLTLEDARRRSELVRLLRMLFMVLAAVAFGLFSGHIIQSALSRSVAPVQLEQDDVVTMVNPRFSGRDTNGASYVITADAAKRRRGEANAVDLVEPILLSGDGTEVRAPSGKYDRDAEVLDLYEDVQLVDPTGLLLRSEGVRYHIEENRIEGLSPLQGSGPMGDITSDRYEVIEEGNRLIFEGNVKTIIYPSPPKNAADLARTDDDLTPAREREPNGSN